jgi:hypothetical protein
LLDNAKKCLSSLDFLEANEVSMKEGIIKQIMLSGKPKVGVSSRM